jgi:SagB-type dehydrogenase family enzyme
MSVLSGSQEVGLSGQRSRPDKQRALPFKRYCHAKIIPLPSSLITRTVSAYELMLGTSASPGGTVRPIRTADRITALASLLAYTIGINRLDFLHAWPWHRVVASARCLYPTDLYVLTSNFHPDTDGRFHYYDANHHRLVLVAKTHNQFELRPLGTRSGFELFLVVTSMIERNSRVYEDFSHTLCSQEAGMVLANAQMAGRYHELHARMCITANQMELQRVLGLDPSLESVAGYVTLSSVPEQPQTALSTFTRLMDPCAQVDEVSAGGRHWRIGAANRAAPNKPGRAVNGSESPGIRAKENCAIADAEVKLTREPPTRVLSMKDAWLRRNSGNTAWLSGILMDMSMSTLAAILQAGGLDALWSSPAEEAHQLPAVYCLVNRVPGIAQGIYLYQMATSSLVTIGHDPVDSVLQDSYPKGNINFHCIPCTLCLVWDHERHTSAYGIRRAAVANQVAGMMAQRMSLMASGLGYAARCVGGIDSARLAPALRIQTDTLTLLGLVLFGSTRGYGLKISLFR